MSASTSFQTAILKLLLTNTAIANIGDSSGLQGSGTAGSLYIALHTADPSSGNQSTSEASYTGYSRVAVARSTSGWSVSGNDYSNVSAVTFGKATAGSSTVTHFSIGTSSTGSGQILLSGALDTQRSITADVTPSFAASALTGSVS